MNLKLEAVTSKEVSLFNKQNPAYIRVIDRGFYLTLTTCNRYDVTVGQYMHLTKGNNAKGIVVEWFILFNSVEQDGYRVCKANHGAAMVLNKPLARLFKMGISCKFGDSFYLEDTDIELAGSRVIKINTNRTVKQK